LKMATGRNFSMSGINSGHHYLSSRKFFMISDNVEFLQPIFYFENDSRHRKISTGLNVQNVHHNTTKIQHCSISKVVCDLFVKPVVSGQFGRFHNR
jgi:hypothetical protein